MYNLHVIEKNCIQKIASSLFEFNKNSFFSIHVYAIKIHNNHANYFNFHVNFPIFDN